MKFTKLHGLGNDFVLIDGVSNSVDLETIRSLAPEWCHRHFGIGADGIIVVESSATNNLKMTIINSDGSEPQMCGNGIRCLAKFVMDENLVSQTTFTVETLAGTIVPTISEGPDSTLVKVDMGEPRLLNHQIPIQGPENQQSILREIIVNGHKFNGTAVSMGNPHFVIFSENPALINLGAIGPLIESAPEFPERTNTEFVAIKSRDSAVMRVWERGAGETLACGTGACAVLVAGVITGQLDRKATIHLPGGPLIIEWDIPTNHVMMTGPAKTVYSGVIHY
ncbi:diaminopimelate epimerase [bacterium]|nr:diaminopimelate epimerase [bacterium]